MASGCRGMSWLQRQRPGPWPYRVKGQTSRGRSGAGTCPQQGQDRGQSVESAGGKGAGDEEAPPMAPPSPPFPRFYKLHERKCEPIVMTVPRKVRLLGSLPTHSLLQQTGHGGGDRGEACEWDLVECGCGRWAGLGQMGRAGMRQGELRPCSGRATGDGQAEGTEVRTESGREPGCSGDSHEEGTSGVWRSLGCPAKSLGRASSFSPECAILHARHVPGSRAVRGADGAHSPWDTDTAPRVPRNRAAGPCSGASGRLLRELLAYPEGK